MPIDHCLAGLRQIRKIRGASVTRLASSIGLSPTSYSRFERGERRVYLDHARTLAKHLGVRVDDLMTSMTEDDAARLCNQRDRDAIAAGTFDQRLWAPGAPENAVDELHDDEPLPPAPPPPLAGEALPAALDGWDVE